ncbi:uncharacterized protein LOC106179961 [Lingula anatina]|uniref:Uncharacterized protein LOC106179961 n=1 Tax=Lingula anatina TaxID=7574 RepID=A0A2R2MQ22_LINAN|nr:uncharacterized protein LOC106179961 [Lingula anatina]|eukprot:XP_023932112.1 uncharacterized protein LOC106179961 [Lingula anatina]
MKEAWVQFKEETSTSISYSKFCCFRPKHTKCMAKDRFKTCCCEYCENITLKKKAVNSVLQTAGHGEMFLGSKFAIADMTCCAPNPVLHLHNKACIDRECENCGISKFHEVMVPMLDNLSDTQTTWSAWRSEKSTYKNKQGTEVTTNKQVLVKIDGPFSQLIAELEEDLHTFAWHLANYQWQQRQFDKLTRDVPTRWLVMCMDYGENFTCAYQDEAQGAHWSRQQITIHPVVCYYRCPDHPEVTTQETFCFISNDLKHDSHGVQHFQQQALQTLLERGINVTQIIHFSDGCPSQYKGKASFIDLSFAKDDTGIPTEKHFFGSRHGKGPCDREIGVVKRLARQAVLRRKCIIATAQDLYEYGCSSLTKPADNSHSHTCRQFFFVREGTIVRDRPDRTGGKGIPGTRKLHCVRGHSPFIVSYKERSCFCEACVTLEGECTNKSFVEDWKEVSLKVNRRQK